MHNHRRCDLCPTIDPHRIFFIDIHASMAHLPTKIIVPKRVVDKFDRYTEDSIERLMS